MMVTSACAFHYITVSNAWCATITAPHHHLLTWVAGRRMTCLPAAARRLLSTAGVPSPYLQPSVAGARASLAGQAVIVAMAGPRNIILYDINGGMG